MPTLVMETAKAEKFSHTVTEALGKAPEPSEALVKLLSAQQYVETIPKDLETLRSIIAAGALN